MTHFQVQHEAERERAALLARIPRLTIGLGGEGLEDVEVTLDSELLPIALLGACQFVDPGHHIVRAIRGSQVITGEIDILEGQHKITTLSFARRESADSLEQTLPSITTRTEVSAATSMALTWAIHGSTVEVPLTLNRRPASESIHRDQAPNATQCTLGWIGLGLGGMGLVVGVVSGISLHAARNDLNEHCVGNRCPSSVASEVEHYNRLRIWSTAGFVAGTVLTGTGLTLLITAPQRLKPLRASLIVGPTLATMLGQF